MEAPPAAFANSVIGQFADLDLQRIGIGGQDLGHEDANQLLNRVTPKESCITALSALIALQR